MKNGNRLNKTAIGWELDAENLSESDEKVLKEVGFPKSIKPGIVLARRTQKRNIGKVGWISKETPNLDDIKYLTVGYSVAKYKVNEVTPREKDQHGRPLSREDIAAQMSKMEEIATSQAFEQFYISADNVQEELEDLLDSFSQPTHTLSMKKAALGMQPKKEAVEKDDDSVKSLSNKDKGIAKRMYKEEGKDLEEITKELGVEKERVKSYLQTL